MNERTLREALVRIMEALGDSDSADDWRQIEVARDIARTALALPAAHPNHARDASMSTAIRDALAGPNRRGEEAKCLFLLAFTSGLTGSLNP